MDIYLWIFLSTISSFVKNDAWVSFWNKDETSVGFKNKSGLVIIEPKFSQFTIAKKFENIVAVSEDSSDKWSSYYLTKSLKIIGVDSLYIFDESFDCENEGFIRFRDGKTDKAGMFNREGQIVVPAIYNDLSRVRNGMIVGLIGAEKKPYGEHFSWIGGQEVLIDTANNVLIDNFRNDNSLNFYSLEKTKEPHSDTVRRSYLAKDGSYYSFIDFENEFKQWITKELKKKITADELISICNDEIFIWLEPDTWLKTKKEKFINDNFTILKKEWSEILHSKTDYYIDSFSSLIFEGAEFEEKYFNNCGEQKVWIYPSMSITLSDVDEMRQVQKHYEFLRTDNGYKIISMTLRNKEIK